MQKNIKIILSQDEIFDLIMRFDKQFEPALSERLEDIEEYSKKLFENAVVIVYHENNNIMAFAAFYCNDFVNKEAYLAQIAVDREYRNKGIAQKLLDFIFMYLKEKNMKLLRLEVIKNNNKAQNIYIKNGFIFEGNETDISFYMIKILGKEYNNE